MARGKSAAAKSKAAVAAPPPTRVHAKPYLCSLCHHHHGRYTKIGAAHRQYRTEKKA